MGQPTEIIWQAFDMSSTLFGGLLLLKAHQVQLWNSNQVLPHIKNHVFDMIKVAYDESQDEEPLNTNGKW